MTKMKKPTKREMFKALKAKYSLTPEETAFIDHELELLSQKATAIRKPTDRQKQNDIYKDDILAFMGENPTVLYTIGDLWKQVPSLASNSDMSSQRITAMIGQLVEAGKVNRIVEKRKTYFQIA